MLPDFISDSRSMALSIQRANAPVWHPPARSLSDITGIDVHHAAGWGSVKRIITRESVGGIDQGGHPYGYHFIISGNGDTHMVANLTDIMSHNRGGGVNEMGFSVADFTRVGVCLVGDFAGEMDPSDFQVKAFNKLYAYLRGLGVPTNLLGHKDWKGVICPGSRWEIWKERLNAGQADVIDPCESVRDKIINDLIACLESMR